MIALSRADDSLLANWWWTVDRWLLGALAFLLVSGLILNFGASVPVAERLGLNPFFFAKRQTVFLLLSFGLMFGLSLLSVDTIRRGAALMLVPALVLLAMTLFFAPEYKGATRWLQFFGLTVQPSEFVKPLLVLCWAWLFAGAIENPDFPGRLIAGLLFAITALLLVLQPDIGQTALLFLVFMFQLVLAGLPAIWIGGMAGAGVLLSLLAYFLLPHVAARIDLFLDPSAGDSYQTDTALNAIRAGGLFGRGPGEGSVKKVLPDAHADYIFAVIGEEFGAIACLAIILLFAGMALHSFHRLASEDDNPFAFFAASGLIALFSIQAMINIAVNLALMPAKGMTLPFISYGGSSMLALGLTMGMVLALTRRNRFQGRTRFAIRRRA
ncbi:MAG: putative peptidoglycan glycosyltransferase FtsW [Rhodothalassiaceae bacterium]